MGLLKEKLIKFKLQFKGAEGHLEIPLDHNYQSFLTTARNVFSISPSHDILLSLLKNTQANTRIEFGETSYKNLMNHCGNSPDSASPNFTIEISDWSDFQHPDSKTPQTEKQTSQTCVHCQTKISEGEEYFKCVICTETNVVYCLVCATTGFNNFHIHPLLYIKLPVHDQFIQQIKTKLTGTNSKTPTQPVQAPVPVQQPVIHKEKNVVIDFPAPSKENLIMAESLKKESSWCGAQDDTLVQETTAKVFVYPGKNTNWLQKTNDSDYKVQIKVDNRSSIKFDKTFCFKRVKGSCNSPDEYVTPIIKPSCEKEFGMNLSMDKVGSKSIWALCKRPSDGWKAFLERSSIDQAEAYGGYVVFECMANGIRLFTIDPIKFKSLIC